MRIEMIQSAGPDTVFAPTALDHTIGKEVPVNGPVGRIGTATVISAEVADDGRTAVIAVETDDAAARVVRDLGMGLQFDGQGFKVTGWDPAEPTRGA